MNWSDWQAELLERIADPSLSAETAPALNPAGLAVYRNNYRVGLIDTLAFIYPVCRQLVGGDFFTGLARVFIGGHPSLSGNLHLYGAAFGDFVAGFEHARELPYLADVARSAGMAGSPRLLRRRRRAGRQRRARRLPATALGRTQAAAAARCRRPAQPLAGGVDLAGPPAPTGGTERGPAQPAGGDADLPPTRPGSGRNRRRRPGRAATGHSRRRNAGGRGGTGAGRRSGLRPASRPAAAVPAAPDPRRHTVNTLKP
ncbi:DNA-binding domain-containing protein [Chromobacterium haemolyticum]|nr:DNA-binding domain-containing protein [Chromobacterium haemolyticum]